MLKALIFLAIGFCAYIIGAFGFTQITGTLKYFNRFRLPVAMFTIVIWAVLLSLAAWLVVKLLPNYIWALTIGYGISFILSLSTKPDNE